MSEIFNETEKEIITRAIEQAELRTSGEIRVHLERKCNEDVLDHAAFIFSELEMHKTADRNGVLIYLSWEDRKFAIIGDAGINARVGQSFWDDAKVVMLEKFRQSQIAEGIAAGVLMAGEKLAAHFPRMADDKNELTNEISYGK